MDDSTEGPISEAELSLWASGVCAGLRPMSPASLSAVRDIYDGIEERQTDDRTSPAAEAG
ncbi:hypothetical protein [Streptomyces sp. WG-D5]